MDRTPVRLGREGRGAGTDGYVWTSGGPGTKPGWEALPAAASDIESGTIMLFVQTAAPTGWTKSTTHNNKALRIVSGAVGTGGSIGFSTVFGLTATDAHQLTTAEMPAHTHTYTQPSSPSSVNTEGATSAVVKAVTASQPSGSAGSDGGHSHNIDLRVQYVDVIIATKD